jgi:ParB-like chromosome segregation protein Spo0J
VSKNIGNYEWVEDFKARDVLDSLALKYTKRTVALKEVNWRATDKNAGRLGFMGKPFSEENVEDYAEAMRRGERFPSPIMAETRDGLVVSAGVHRCKAALRAGMTEVLSYVFTTDLPHYLRLVAVLTNRKEGVRVSRTESLEYALDLCSNSGMDPKNVATMLGVSFGTLEMKLRVQDLRKQMAEAGHKTNLPESMLRVLYRLRNNTIVMMATARLAEDLHLAESAVIDLCKRVQEAKSESAQLKLIEEERHNLENIATAPTQTGDVQRIAFPVRTNFLKALNQLKRVVEGKKTTSELQISAEEAESVKSLYFEVRKALNSIFK